MENVVHENLRHWSQNTAAILKLTPLSDGYHELQDWNSSKRQLYPFRWRRSAHQTIVLYLSKHWGMCVCGGGTEFDEVKKVSYIRGPKIHNRQAMKRQVTILTVGKMRQFKGPTSWCGVLRKLRVRLRNVASAPPMAKQYPGFESPFTLRGSSLDNSDETKSEMSSNINRVPSAESQESRYYSSSNIDMKVVNTRKVGDRLIYYNHWV